MLAGAPDEPQFEKADSEEETKVLSKIVGVGVVVELEKCEMVRMFVCMVLKVVSKVLVGAKSFVRSFVSSPSRLSVRPPRPFKYHVDRGRTMKSNRW